jgi:hypothetical protein
MWARREVPEGLQGVIKMSVATMPNAATVSRMISKAGFRKALEGTTRIPGYHVFTEGFKVEVGMSSVLVRYEFSSSIGDDRAAANARRDEVMPAIASLLTGKGFDVTSSELQPNLLMIKKAVA